MGLGIWENQSLQSSLLLLLLPQTGCPWRMPELMPSVACG